jgi:hypothetical protein
MIAFVSLLLALVQVSVVAFGGSCAAKRAGDYGVACATPIRANDRELLRSDVAASSRATPLRVPARRGGRPDPRGVLAEAGLRHTR